MKNKINNRYKKQRAQSVLEYAVLVACLAGALLVMQIYVKRGIQGRVRDAADEIGEQYSAITTTSRLTQVMRNLKDVTTTGKPVFIELEVTDETGAKRKEKREIMEITRKEPVTIYSPPYEVNYEKTGKLSDEDLFPKQKDEKN